MPLYHGLGHPLRFTDQLWPGLRESCWFVLRAFPLPQTEDPTVSTTLKKDLPRDVDLPSLIEGFARNEGISQHLATAESNQALRAIPPIELWITARRDGRICPQISGGTARNMVFHPFGLTFTNPHALTAL